MKGTDQSFWSSGKVWGSRKEEVHRVAMTSGLARDLLTRDGVHRT